MDREIVDSMMVAAYGLCGIPVVWLYNRQTPAPKRSGKYSLDDKQADKMAQMVLIPMWPVLLFAISMNRLHGRRRQREKNSDTSAGDKQNRTDA